MVKRKPEIRMRTYGIYTKWDSESKELPKIREITTRVPAELHIEFGFIIQVKGAKNQELYYCINHPGILDSEGRRREPFDGTVYVKSNEWDFYLRPTIRQPITDTLWYCHMCLDLNVEKVEEKTSEVFNSSEPHHEASAQQQ